MFGTMGFSELILILVIVLIIFGAGRLPQIGEGVGKALKGFRKEVTDVPQPGSGQVQQETGQPQAIQTPTNIAATVPPPATGSSPSNDETTRSLCPWSGTDTRHHCFIAVQHKPSDSATIGSFPESSIGVCRQPRAIDGGTGCSPPPRAHASYPPLPAGSRQNRPPNVLPPL